MGFRSKQARKAAARFLAGVQAVRAPAELPALLTLTAAHLSERFAWCDDTMAYEAALTAWSEIQGRQTRCFIDLAASTEHLLILVDPVAQTRRPIPTVDLVRLLGPRAAAA
jgi:hypothetical protein